MDTRHSEVLTFEVLTGEEVEAVRGSSLRVLQQVGVRVQDPEVRRIFVAAGGEMEGEVVRLPEPVVLHALASAPGEVTLYGRGGLRLSSAGERHHHGPAPSAVALVDYLSGQRQPATYQDVANLTRVADALPGLDFMSPLAFAQDCPPSYSGLLTAEAVFCNTDKHCMAFALNWGDAEAWMALAELAGGGDQTSQPLVSFAISPSSPLVLARHTTDILLRVARRGFPIVTLPGGMTGGTNPYTLAGTLVLEHAQALLAIVLAQLVRPGLPCVHGFAPVVMDMQSGNVSLGGPERTLTLNAVPALSKAWGLPSYAPVGLSDSFVVDAQSGAEKMLSLVTCLATGLDFGSGVGRMEGGLSTSCEALVVDHELLEVARRYIRGIRVDEETLAEEAIARVGPAGDFLTDEHTLRFLRSDEYGHFPLFNRRPMEQGGSTMLERAHQEVERILAEHPSPVSAALQAEFRACIAERVKGGQD